MANVDLSVDPYYDRFSDTSNYDFVAFVKDRILQGSELNEVQSIFNYYLKQTGDAIMSDGDKQSGLSYTQTDNNITVASGEVYLGGKVRSFDEQTVTINGVGIETVGVKLDQTEVTSSTDSSLLNPAIGTAGYQANGANRIKETVTLVANDGSAATIYEFKDGSLYYTPDNKQLTKVSNMMAQRTSEIEGNFRLGNTGFELSTQEDTSDSSKAILNIASGIAYIQGVRVNKSTATQIECDKSMTTATITDEENSYVSGTYVYALGTTNVDNVTSVTANIQKTAVVTRGTTSTDGLPDNTVISISRVYTEGTNNVVYTAGTDYTLTNHQTIVWTTGGSSPSQGASYKVTYIYNKLLSASTDYAITTDSDTNTTSIDFTGKSIVTSTDDSTGILYDGAIINATYNYYLYRKDVVTIDQNGDFTIHVGQPNDIDDVTAPYLNDATTLEIGSIQWYPNSYTSDCDTYATSNLTFASLTELKTRVDNIEFNEALTELDDQATASYDPTDLRGVFSDGFISFDKADVDNDDFSVKVNFETGEISPEYASSSDSDLTLDTDDSNVIISPDGKYMSAGYTELQIESQPVASSAILINEFDYFGKTGSMTLDPDVDMWTNYSD